MLRQFTHFLKQTPDEFARYLGIIPELEQTSMRISELETSLTNYNTYTQRSNDKIDSSLINETKSYVKKLEDTRSNYLSRVHLGATSIESAFSGIDSLSQVNTIPKNRGKRIFGDTTNEFTTDLFTGNILRLNFIDKNFPREKLSPVGSCLELPFSLSDADNYFKQRSSGIENLVNKGSAALNIEGKLANKYQALHAAIAGYLLSAFPADEFRFHYNMQFLTDSYGTWKEACSFPIGVFKKDTNRAVALVDFIENGWSARQMLPTTFISQNSRVSESFLRGFSYDHYSSADAVLSFALKELFSDKNRAVTADSCRQLGIPPAYQDK